MIYFKDRKTQEFNQSILKNPSQTC